MSKYKAYFAIEKRLQNQGFDIERSEVIEEFTNSKKNSLSELNYIEYKELLKWLQKTFKLEPSQPDWQNTPENKMRRKVIAVFRKMGYKMDSGLTDMNAINQWCINKGHAHKELNEYKYKELVKLVTQAENMFIKTIRH